LGSIFLGSIMKRDRQTKAAADVFPVSSVREVLAPLTSQTASEVPVTHCVLPNDAPTAIKQLNDQVFERFGRALSKLGERSLRRL
jgi:hypothetical protein